MNGKKRGIRLKQVNEEQEGYRALLDFFALDPDQAVAMSESGLDLVTDVDQGMSGACDRSDAPRLDDPRTPSPVTARQKLTRLLREELEETLMLLEEALTVRKED